MNKLLLMFCILIVPIGVMGAESVPKISQEQLETSYSWPVGDDNERLKAALKNAKIPFNTYEDEAGREWIEWTKNYDQEVERIQTELFGSLPPNTRSVSFSSDEDKETFLDWLKSEQIPFSIVLFHGDEYIVWDDIYSQRVVKHEFIPEFQ